MTNRPSTDPDQSWTIAGGAQIDCAPFVVAAIVNVTPDSFHDGGVHDAPAAAIAHARACAIAGAHILDVGGESTRPGSQPVDEATERDRVLPVVRALAAEHIVSVDTAKASVARAALDAGAAIINDVTAWRDAPALLEVLAHYRPGYVLMHSLGPSATMQDNPRYTDVVDEVVAHLEAKLAELVRAGVPEACVVLDPGIGFGKTLAHNLALMAGVGRIAALGRPVYMGLSHKRFITDLAARSHSLHGQGLNSLHATVAATVETYRRGARIHRVHDVAPALTALTVASAIGSAL